MTEAREGRVKETERFETENLIIRRTQFEDLEQFYLWEQRPEVTEFFSIRDGQTREEVYHKFFADEDNPSAEQFTILMKNGSPIGRIVLADIIPGWKAELWRIYIGDASLRGKGYGRQAMEAIMAHCFEDLQLERLYLDHYTGNPAGFLYENLGFHREGVLRKNCRKNGVLYDVHLMSMLRSEYFTK